MPPVHPSTAEVDNDIGVQELDVLVTGYGAFENIDINPSYLIASTLPDTFEFETHPTSSLESRASVSCYTNGAQEVLKPTPSPRKYLIRIHKHPEPLTVTYPYVLSLFPDLISPSPSSIIINVDASRPHPPRSGPKKYDWVLHLGVAGGGAPVSYQLEHLAHRDGHHRTLLDPKGLEYGKPWVEKGCPEILSGGWNEQDVLARWQALTAQKFSGKPSKKKEAKDKHEKEKEEKIPKTKISYSAGMFLCEYILYCSLATRIVEAKKGDIDEAGKVAFLHVPPENEEPDIERGRKMAVMAIQSLVGSWDEGHRAMKSETSGARDEMSVMPAKTSSSKWKFLQSILQFLRSWVRAHPYLAGLMQILPKRTDEWDEEPNVRKAEKGGF